MSEARNVHTHIEGSKLIIEIDVSSNVIQQAPLSGSGKSKVVASTHGFLNLDDGLSIGLNVIKTQPRHRY